MSTAHNSAGKNEIAKTVLMPGDPLRAKLIADTFLENVVQFNTVRNMFGYTGTFNGKEVSVMGSGMGMPSIGIYSYELYNNYGVESIIRIGSAGAYTADLDLYDVLLADSAWSESSYAETQNGTMDEVILPNQELNDKIVKVAKELDIHVTVGRIHSSDVFYREDFSEYIAINKEHGCLAVEMESFALFHNANVLGKKAACILTVSDNLVTSEVTSPDERQNAFTNMMKIALNVA